MEQQNTIYNEKTKHAPMFVGTFETGHHYKVHKSYKYVAPFMAIIVILAVVLLNSAQWLVALFFAMRDGRILVNPLVLFASIGGGFVVLAAVFVGIYTLAWRNMFYVFDESEFSFYSGIITKRHVHMPYSRVQSVNYRASIIQRIVGVCTVVIDSAGGSANRCVRVPYLRLETAERLQAELFIRKAAIAAGCGHAIVFSANTETSNAASSHLVSERTDTLEHVASVTNTQSAQTNVLDATMGMVGSWRGIDGGAAVFSEEPVVYEHRLSDHELLLTTFSHDKPIAVALTIGFSFMVMLAFLILVQDDFARFLALAAFPIVLFSTLLTWVIGLISVLLSYGNFCVRRRGSRIEVERGLLTRVSSGIDIARVQSIEIRQTFIRRLIGYCEISLGRVSSASEQGKGNNNSSAAAKGLVIHPFVKIDRAEEILAGLTPELADRPHRSDSKPLPKVSLRRALLRRCVWFNWALWVAILVVGIWEILRHTVHIGMIHFASVGSQMQYEQFMTESLTIIITVCAIITGLRAIGVVLWARHSSYNWNHHYLLVHNDGLSTAECILPRQKIQAGSTCSNPFQRRLSLVTLQAITAAGAGSTIVQLRDVPVEDGNAYLRWLR